MLSLIVYCYFIWWSPFIPSRNLDEVFTDNHITLMSLRSRYHTCPFVKAAMVLTRVDYLFIHVYCTQLYNINSILRTIIIVRTGLELR